MQIDRIIRGIAAFRQRLRTRRAAPGAILAEIDACQERYAAR